MTVQDTNWLLVAFIITLVIAVVGAYVAAVFYFRLQHSERERLMQKGGETREILVRVVNRIDTIGTVDANHLARSVQRDQQGHPVHAKWAASDQEGCRRCGQTWDRNDPYPPHCADGPVRTVARQG